MKKCSNCSSEVVRRYEECIYCGSLVKPYKFKYISFWRILLSLISAKFFDLDPEFINSFIYTYLILTVVFYLPIYILKSGFRFGKQMLKSSKLRKDLTTQEILWNRGFTVSDGYLFDILKVLYDRVTNKIAFTDKHSVLDVFNLNEIVDMSFSYDKLTTSNSNYMRGAIAGKMFGSTVGVLSGLPSNSSTVETLYLCITLRRGNKKFYLAEKPNEDASTFSSTLKQKNKEIKEFITGLGVMI